MRTLLTIILLASTPLGARTQIPNEIHFPSAKFDEIGRKIEAEMRPKLEEKLKELRKTGVFIGITGDYKPAYELEYKGHRREVFEWSGNRAPAIILRYRVKARVKLDAFGGILTTKFGAVE